jgi:DtxR family transcriptional regulator, Mn-dependent transcriptional regulator
MNDIGLSRNAQDYLKAIYCLEKESDGVSVSRLADSLGVSAPSVTSMVKKLALRKLVKYSPYLSIALTKAGESKALEVVRHHRLLETYLQKALGLGLDKIHDEADRLEHEISEELEERIDVFLGRPAFDPHGSPIPDLKGNVKRRDLVTSESLEPGQVAIVSQLTCRSPEQLMHLESIGLLPGVKIRMERKDAGAGVVYLKIGAQRSEPIGGSLAGHVHVMPFLEQ